MRLRPETAPPMDADPLAIMLRCFTRPFKADAQDATEQKKPRGRTRKRADPSDLVFIFDSETTTDPAQRLRVLFYQIRERGDLIEEAAAYDPDALSTREVKTLRAYCAYHGLPDPMPLDEFREDVFLRQVFACGMQIVGFNLAFDLARIATDWGMAQVRKWSPIMRAGFSLSFSDNIRWPNLRLKRLGPRSAIFDFAAPYRQRTSRPDRKRGQTTPTHRGQFVDVRTLAAAMTSRSHSLKSLCKALGTTTQKEESEEHGGRLSLAYLDYARSDVQATWECFDALVTKLTTFGINSRPHEIFSEATIGKGILSAIGVKPALKFAVGPSPQLLGHIIGSYFGGRTEVRIRKSIRQVVQTDFMSMYPTVCTLQRLWQFMIAQGVRDRDATAETRKWLATLSVQDLQSPETWRCLAVLVRVKADRDLFPVRACYPGEKHPTIGLNYLTTQDEIWVTLADCIAAWILTGKLPEVLEAKAFQPGPVQRGLKPIKLFGRHEVDPYEDDLFRRVIQLRVEVRGQAKSASGTEREVLDEEAQNLKIVANSTSYGIFIQTNVDTLPDPATVEVFGNEADPFLTKSRKAEAPGPFYHPLLATLITGGARLMLALAEHRAGEEGLDWVFCDTDSLALAKPAGVSEPEFHSAADRVVEWFRPLNPYGLPESILKIEDANYGVDDPKKRVPLFCLAISSKRYVLFNMEADGAPLIRKGSAHGLGHLIAPYDETDPAPGIPRPRGLIPGQDKLALWQHDLWFKIIEAENAGQLHELQFDFHNALKQPAFSRYAATTPELLRWFKTWNAGRTFAEGVKPFGFMYALHARPAKGAKAAKIFPIAPFDRDLRVAISRAFDRQTDRPLKRSELRTYADELAGYQLKPESKFANARAFDRGLTERRHVYQTAVELIGKEADHYEESYALGLGLDPTIYYGSSHARMLETYRLVREVAVKYGDLAVATATGLARASVARVRNGENVQTKVAVGKIKAGLVALIRERSSEEERRQTMVEGYLAAIKIHGRIRSAARSLGLDASNFSKRLKAYERGTLLTKSS